MAGETRCEAAVDGYKVTNRRAGCGDQRESCSLSSLVTTPLFILCLLTSLYSIFWGDFGD